jgi:hypothetical protein
MTMRENEPKDVGAIDLVRSTNLTTLLGSIHWACVMPVSHKGSGTHSYATTGLPAMLLMIVYGAGMPCPMLLNFVPIWLGFVLYRRIRADPKQNSRFRGWFFRNSFFWQLAEPVFFLALGYVLYQFDKPLGNFVMMLFLSISTVLAIESVSMAERLRKIRDAQVEMEYLASKR